MQLTEEDKMICSQVVNQYLSGKIADPVTAGICSHFSSIFYESIHLNLYASASFCIDSSHCLFVFVYIWTLSGTGWLTFLFQIVFRLLDYLKWLGGIYKTDCLILFPVTLVQHWSCFLPGWLSPLIFSPEEQWQPWTLWILRMKKVGWSLTLIFK